MSTTLLDRIWQKLRLNAIEWTLLTDKLSLCGCLKKFQSAFFYLILRTMNMSSMEAFDDKKSTLHRTKFFILIILQILAIVISVLIFAFFIIHIITLVIVLSGILSQIFCGNTVCYIVYHHLLGLFDWMVNAALSIVVIILVDMALIIRVMK
jgi:hypothetical protein